MEKVYRKHNQNLGLGQVMATDRAKALLSSYCSACKCLHAFFGVYIYEGMYVYVRVCGIHTCFCRMVIKD